MTPSGAVHCALPLQHLPARDGLGERQGTREFERATNGIAVIAWATTAAGAGEKDEA